MGVVGPKNAGYIATYLGNAIRGNWSGVLHLWEKATSSSPNGYRHCPICLPLFRIERRHTGHCGFDSGGSALFCQDVRAAP
jgi:hypothetical protein